MNFLAARSSAEGTCIEAEVDGSTNWVFPIVPNLSLLVGPSAVRKARPENNKLYQAVELEARLRVSDRSVCRLPG